MNYGYSEEELRWAEEVRYLHSLWHRGPPNQPQLQHQSQNPPSRSSPHAPTFNPPPSSSYPNPTTNPYSYAHPYPYPYPTPYYHNLPRTHLPPQISNEPHNQEPSPGNEWPCDPAALPAQSSPRAWSPFQLPAPKSPLTSNASTPPSSSSLQLAAIQTCKLFFTQDSDSDSDPDPESGGNSDSEHDVDEFFRSLFDNDAQLRACYQKHHQDGQFYCLVCETRKGAKGKGKLYRGCTALAQHASAVTKLGRRADHKAFATAICRVLGLDPQRLPSIVLLPGSVLIAGHSEGNRMSNPNNPETSKRDANDGTSGPISLDREPVNSPGASVSPPKDFPAADDFGTKKTSKGKCSDEEVKSINYVKKTP